MNMRCMHKLNQIFLEHLRSLKSYNQFDQNIVTIGLSTQTIMLLNVVQKPPLQLLTPSECTISNTDAMPN